MTPSRRVSLPQNCFVETIVNRSPNRFFPYRNLSEVHLKYEYYLDTRSSYGLWVAYSAVCVSKSLIKLVRAPRRMFMAGILTRQLVWLLVCVCDDRGTFRGWLARAACESKRAAWIGEIYRPCSCKTSNSGSSHYLKTCERSLTRPPWPSEPWGSTVRSTPHSNSSISPRR